jgi:putative glycosyltransferase (TIGR04372 family)
MVDLAFKMRSLGWWSGEPVFLARRHTIANKLLFGLLTEHHTVVYEDGPDPHLWSDLRSLQRLASFPFNVFQREDGDVCSWNEAGALLTRAWKGDHPLRSAFDAWCSSSDRFQAKMRRMTRDLRLDDSKFHVCLHVRDDGFYNDQSQSHRNASLDSYLDIVKIVRERGGVVVRMGAATAPAAPQVPGLIDYAHTRWKSEEMDLYLMRTARCFVGAVSGLSNLAVSLDLPSAFVNSISYDAQMWHSKARFIPKTVYTREGKPLTQRELSSDQWRWHLFSATSMRDAGLRAEGNTNDEIRNIVIELLQDCENPAPVSRSDLTALWEADLCIPHYYGAATPSSYYLQKHSRTFLRDVDPLVV